jgi:hypothetical protein
MLDTEITIAKMKNNKAPRGDDVKTDKGSVEMQWICRTMKKI